MRHFPTGLISLANRSDCVAELFYQFGNVIVMEGAARLPEVMPRLELALNLVL